MKDRYFPLPTRNVVAKLRDHWTIPAKSALFAKSSSQALEFAQCYDCQKGKILAQKNIKDL